MGEQGQEKLQTDDGLEFLDLEPEVKEFVRAEARHEAEPDKKEDSHLWMALLLAAAVAVALCGILWLKLPAAIVLLVVILEAALGACLRHAPLWLHGVVLVGNLVLGIVFELAVFLLLADLVYLAEIVSSYFQRRTRERRKR